MKRFLFDTKILGNLIKPTPSDALLAWLATQTDETLFIACLTVAKIKRGILELPAVGNAQSSKLSSPAGLGRPRCSPVESYRSTSRQGWSGPD